MSNNIAPIGPGKTQRPSSKLQSSSFDRVRPRFTRSFPNPSKGSAFKQQKLSAWQPILTVGTVVPTFFLIGVAFIPVGIGLLISSYQVQEYEIDYTSCESFNGPKTLTPNGTAVGTRCSELIALYPTTKCTCVIDIELDHDYKRDVFIYYGLTNFYQNHRRYVKSRDDFQLLGNLKAGRECNPYAQRLDPEMGVYKPIVPCGAIANSMFNDTFHLSRILPKSKSHHARGGDNSINGLHLVPQELEVPLMRTGIAWATDKYKFRNPPLPPGVKSLAAAFNGTMRPLDWSEDVWELDPKDPNNNGLQNEGFIVWMRTAAFPTFRKLYARIAHDKRDKDVDYQDGLPKGKYRLRVQYKYPVAGFKGRKRFIISNTSWLGGKNPFIGGVYVVIGMLALILTGAFLVIHKKFGASNVENLNITSQMPYAMR